MKGYLLKKADIDAMEGKPYSHFLNSNAHRITRSLGDPTGLSGLGFHLITVPPGFESTEFHVHQYEDECTYVLCGTGEVLIGEESSAIGPGDFIGYRKGGKPHTMKNTGDEALVCIVAGQRLAHDICDYPKQQKRLYTNQGQKTDLVDYQHIDAQD